MRRRLYFRHLDVKRRYLPLSLNLCMCPVKLSIAHNFCPVAGQSTARSLQGTDPDGNLAEGWLLPPMDWYEDYSSSRRFRGPPLLGLWPRRREGKSRCVLRRAALLLEL